MKCQVNDVVMNDCPKFLDPNLTEFSHLLIAPNPLDQDDPLVIPLSLDGVSSVFPVRAPTREEFLSGDFPRVDMTSEDLTWDPGTTSYEEQEDAMIDHKGELIEFGNLPTNHITLRHSLRIRPM